MDVGLFGHADAWTLGSIVVEIAQRRSLAIAVAIWLGEQRVFHAALPGTSASNDSWLDRKAALVRRYDASSLRTALWLREKGITEATLRIGLDPLAYSLAGGAHAIRVRGTAVGVLAISGLDDVSDHQLGEEALRLFAERSL
jgi:uncharacterized protein (UPF0303 family)